MNIVVNGTPTTLSKLKGRLVGRLAEWGRLNIKVLDGDRSYVFECSDRRGFRRCSEALTKETGTNDWIRTYVKKGEVFYDIGANVGVYSIMAGQQVGPTGSVYAFEPHAANFAQLLRNIKLNGLQNVIRPCCVALHSGTELVKFNYMTLGAARGHSQVNQLVDFSGEKFEAELSEPKISFSLDDLVSRYGFPPPDHVKIDVDGNEGPILNGMAILLKSDKAPKSIQVELSKMQAQELHPFLEEMGYRAMSKHYTKQGLRRIAAGEDPENYPYNVIFCK